jgi:hypothetical protein
MLCSRPMRRFSSVLVGFGFAALLVGCRQGEGERCQVNADCEEPLVCTESVPHTCETSASTGPSDGGIDTPLDAEIDGAPDAATDAALPIDSL